MTDLSKTVVYVTYEGTADARFDRKYYCEGHLPLVRRLWGPFGLDRVEAFYPASAGAGTIAIAELHFRDRPSMEAAFASSGTREVMDDVARFTDLAPVRLEGLTIPDEGGEKGSASSAAEANADGLWDAVRDQGAV